MLTTLLILLPFIGAALSVASGANNARKVALATSIAELALATFAYVTYKTNPLNDALLTTNVAWSSVLGSNFHVSMDGISLLMVLLTAVVTPLIVLSSFSKEYSNSRSFYALLLTMQAALVGVFTAMDGLVYYVFWELALIPIWFICLLFGGEGRQRITFKFFIYTLFGSLFMLAALIYVASRAGSYDIQELYTAGKALSQTEQTWVFWALFLAFGIKMPIFPLHTWQPDTYTNAPTQGTMLLSGIMLKMGTYSLVRWMMPMVPLGVAANGKIAITLAVISIVYASCIAIAQKDFKRMIAYSSIAHVGLIAAGLMSWNVIGVQGGMVQMLSHGINVVGLFFIYDIIASRVGTGEMNVMGGIRSVAPQLALAFLIILLGSVALPLTNGFVGEFLLLNGLYQYDFWLAVFGGLTVVLGAVYMLRGYQKMMLGETTARTASFTDLTSNEKWVLIPICILVILCGVYPDPILKLTEPSVKVLIEGVASGWMVK